MDDPNDPMRLPLPPSRPTSLLPTTSISAENSPESDSEAGFGAAGERPREREPSPDGRAPRSPAEHDTIDGAKLPPTISGIGDGLTPPRPETTIDGTIYADVGVQAVDKPSVVVTADVADDAEEQERKAEEAAEFKRECPWEETVEKRYPAPNPEFFTEFEKKYPPDAHGEEASPNARVWRVYRDRVTELDDDLLEGWHKTLDVLLIFVGLFSAIATAFIIEAYKGLQPDYGEITARGVVALLSQVNSSFAAPLPIPSIDQVDASSRTLWINALWFASLTLALIDALLCILVKQWLVEYASKQRQPAASGRTWAWRHYAFRQGLDKWGIGVFISSLSVILYGALYLFLFGLLVFLFDLDRRLCVVSMGLTMLIGSLHLVSVFLPLWFGDCPTTTPVLTHLRWIGAFCKHAVMRIWVYSITAASLPARWFSESAWDPVPASASPASTTVLSPAAYDGSRIIEGREPLRDALVISWMLSNLPADNDVLIAIGAVGSLDRERHDKYDWSAENPLRSDFVGPIAERRLRDLLRPGGHRDQIMRHLQQSSVMRALLLLQWKSRDEVFLVSLGSLFDVAVHDVSILSNILLQVVYFDDPRDRFFHTRILGKLSLWYSKYPTAPAPLQEVTRQHLLLNSKLAIQDSLKFCSTRLRDGSAHGLLELIGQDSPSSPAFYPVLRLLASFLDDNNDSDASQKIFAQLDAVTGRIAPSDTRLPAMYWSSFLFGSVGRLSLPEVRNYCLSIYTSSLKQLSYPRLKMSWPLDMIEICLAPFALDATAQLDWKPSDIQAAVSVLAQAVSNAEDRPKFWSKKLNRSLRGLLKCRRKINDGFHGFDDKITSILSILLRPTHDSVLSKLETHSAPGSFIRDTMVNILSQSRSNDGLSTWDLLHDDNQYLAQYLAKALVVELAIIFHVSLADLLAPDDNLAELLYNLAGGDRGIRLALASTRYFVITASHGRVVSPQWWDNIKTQLQSLTEERWSKRDYKHQHATPQALVAEIEAVGPCKRCTTTIIEARKLLDARAVVDSTPTMPQSGDAESSRSHGHGSDGALTGAASPNGWRRRTGHLLKYFGISGPQRSGDTEMQLGARIETVEED